MFLKAWAQNWCTVTFYYIPLPKMVTGQTNITKEGEYTSPLEGQTAKSHNKGCGYTEGKVGNDNATCHMTHQELSE